LPKETANYVPSFLSTLYLFEYASEHNIETEKIKHLQLLTDTLLIKKKVSFSHISDEINIPLDSLKFLNPAYVHNIIPLIKNKDHFLTLPQIYTENFIQKESIIYEQAALDYDSREKPLPHLYELNSRTVYKVVSGDFLGKIANNYGVNISNIKKWNKLKNDRLNIGQRLILFPRKFPKKQ
jgi:membrane-bound lytic murein transglycosylase D